MLLTLMVFEPELPVCGKPFRAVREYLETAKRLEGFRIRFAFRCFMTPGVLPATSTLFILKRNYLNVTDVK
ncbi:hypothetical protein N7449_005107 [Penicillium cf. viridicatum]|uniref:Uncharacterized protein n=1 Tax=Penicillium cf. viridicatum TaxID=2972119 RepID=A0A9W9SYQ0_9EURO|nr:hypothetical protein N7449_005107 [Penicillium cf. viridicatum]